MLLQKDTRLPAKNMKLNPNSRDQITILKLFSILAVLLPLVLWVTEHLVLVKTRSINHHVVWKSPRSPLQLGRFVLFSLDDWPAALTNRSLLMAQEKKWLNSIRGQLLVKRLGCQAGQQLTTLSTNQQTYYLCDGHPVAKAIEHPAHHFVFNGIIPAQKAFVIGDHKQSLDSRYFGLVTLDRAQRVLTTAELLRLK